MSEPLRGAAAVEGPTDAIVLRAVLDRLLGSEITATWPSVSAQCAEAARFDQEFRTALPRVRTSASPETDSPPQPS